jgi:hypothetical protein
MQSPRTRRVQRVHLAQPLLARLGATQVVLVDVSVLGARVEHHVPLLAGGHTKLSFTWEDAEIATDCRIVRSRLERFSVGADGLTVYHSGLEFDNMPEHIRTRLKGMIGLFIKRALDEQKLNARGVVPEHSVDKMPIFRYGQLTSNNSEKELIGSSVLPASRIAQETGYVCYHLDNRQWRQKRTHDPGQPAEGFTIAATEDQDQAGLLCQAYERSDRDGRKLIQLFAQLSIMQDDTIQSRRFEP